MNSIIKAIQMTESYFPNVTIWEVTIIPSEKGIIPSEKDSSSDKIIIYGNCNEETWRNAIKNKNKKRHILAIYKKTELELEI